MKKIFFLAALAISAMSYAQTSDVNWYDVVTADNNDVKNGANFVGGANYENVQVNEAGDLFVTAVINSVSRDPHATLFATTVETVPGKANMAQTVPAPVFAKVNADGESQWVVAATDGNYKSYTSLPLADGGLLVALVAHQAIQDVVGLSLNGSDAKVAHSLDKVQYGLLVKIATDGKPAILAKFAQAEEGKTDGIQVRKLVTDGTNFYLLANLKSKVAINGTELEPAHDGGSLAVLKFDDNGAFQGAVQTGGIAITSSSIDLQFADKKLYITCSLKGAVDNTLSIGNTSVTLDNANTNIVVFVANDDLTGNAIKFIAGQTAGSKNVITTYSTQLIDGKLFISGFYQGGIAGVDNNETGKNRAFVVALNLTSGEASGVQLPAAAASGISSINADGLLVKGDSLYAYYYDWSATGDRIFLQAISKDMKLGSRIGLVSTPSMTATRAAAFLGDDLVYEYYAQKGHKTTVSADETIQVNPTDMNRGVIVSQKVFKATDPTDANPVSAREIKAVSKQLNAGNVYVISGDKVFTSAGQRIQ